MCFAFNMKYISIIQRFIPLQFGEVNKESNLFEGFKDCLEKINAEGVMILNDFSSFQAYFNDGIRSQISNYNHLYTFVHIQFAGFVLYFFSVSTNIFGNLVIIFLFIGQYGLCWTLIHLDKQNRFIYQIQEWNRKLLNDINQVNDLIIESGTYMIDKTSFNEDKYAKLWLKEMSTSMDMPWESILIEFLPGDTIFVPKVRVSLGGIRKSIQNASAYGFSSGVEGDSPNFHFKLLRLLSRKKKIKFFGLEEEKKFIKSRVDELIKHLELLFGKRDDPPIIFDDENQEWSLVVNVVDRASSSRNSIKQSLDIFIKILNSCTGNDLSV